MLKTEFSSNIKYIVNLFIDCTNLAIIQPVLKFKNDDKKKN